KIYFCFIFPNKMFLIFIQSLFIIVFIIALIIGLGFGLYYSVMYIEEHTYAAKDKIEMIIQGILILHIYLLLRGMRIFVIVFSLISNLIFYNLLSSYPYILASNVNFIAGCVAAFINHFLFLQTTIANNYNALEIILYFIIFVWVVPFCFFLSLTANDDTFPVKGNIKRKTWIGRILERVKYAASK
ncbi:Transmembrane adaptor Erv26, partial [Spraguea lophii 42_110]